MLRTPLLQDHPQESRLRLSAKVLHDYAGVDQPRRKVGLVGRNGAGKSSLFASSTAPCTRTAATFPWPRSGAWRRWTGMPETRSPRRFSSLPSDTHWPRRRPEVAAAEASDDGERMAHAYRALHDAGSHAAQSARRALSSSSIPVRDLNIRSTAFPAPGACGSNWRAH